MPSRGERGSGSPPGGPGPPVSAAFLLAQVGAHAAARFAERLAPLGLVPAHAGALRVIGSTTGISQRRLGEILGMFPSRLVGLIDQLEGRGLVERRDDPSDRRSYALHPTEEGRRILKEIRAIARGHDDALLAALGAEERAQLRTLLGRVADQQGLTPGVHPGFRRL